MQEAACSSLGVLHSRRGQHAKAKDMFERNFVISRKVVNARQEGAATGRCLVQQPLASVPSVFCRPITCSM